MKKETKGKNEKVALDNTDYFKEYRKTDSGKKSIAFPIIGIVILLISSIVLGFIVGDAIAIMENECPNHQTTYLGWSLIVIFLSWASGILFGIYFGQVRQYYLTKKK